MWPLNVLLRSSRKHPLRSLLLACGLGGLGLLALVVVGIGLSGRTDTVAAAKPAPPALPAPSPAQVVPAPVLPVAPVPEPVVAAAPTTAKEPRAGDGYYRRVARKKVTRDEGASFVPLYQEAQRTFGVAWQLIAAVHRQETAFSTVAGTYEGLNAFGCCAGPMQFNVTNGPVSTWGLYKASFKQGTRPARYPHSTRFHPSVYDDFDAIMAAGALLRDGGATGKLDGGSWLAAYGYYGRDTFGVTYASQVLGRAQGWAQGGFCPDCADDAGRVAALDDAYGVDARRELLSAAERADQEKEAKREARAKARRVAAAERKRAAAKRKATEPAAKAKAKEPARATDKPKAATGNPAPKEPAAKPAPAPKPVAPAAPAPSGPTATQDAPAPPATGSTCTNLAGLGC